MGPIFIVEQIFDRHIENGDKKYGGDSLTAKLLKSLKFFP